MIKELKDKLISEYWTEEFHLGLEDIDQEKARTIVESMTKKEISRKVNVRKFQEDYIADYLEYIWEISESSFWGHVLIVIDDKEGLLWSDNMFYIEVLCNEKVPSNVLQVVLDFLISNDCDQDIDAIGCVVKAQVDKFDRIIEIDEYIESLNLKSKKVAKSRIKNAIKTQCNYTFYD